MIMDSGMGVADKDAEQFNAARQEAIDAKLRAYRALKPEQQQAMRHEYTERFKDCGKDTTQWGIERYFYEEQEQSERQ